MRLIDHCDDHHAFDVAPPSNGKRAVGAQSGGDLVFGGRGRCGDCAGGWCGTWSAGRVARWTLHRRFGVGEAPEHEDRARWPSLLLQRTQTGLNGTPGSPRRRRRVFKKEKEMDFPLARCIFFELKYIRGVWKAWNCGNKLKRRRKLPRLATFKSLLLPKLMRESSALPAKGRKPNRQSDDAQQSSAAAEMSSDFSGRQASAFYSCLAIPVEGATPIQDQETQPKSTASQSTTAPKRAPRKSKTDALAAMQIQANSSDDKSQSSYQVTGVRTFDDPGPPIAVSPVLDMSSVKTAGPRSPPPRNHPRPFGLEDCPTYYPTMEEFKDPLGYIRSISEHAKNYAICKIVPPESWKMPFTTDSEVYLSLPHSRVAPDGSPRFSTHRPSVSRQGCSASTLSRLRREPKSTSLNNCIGSTNNRVTLVFPSQR